MQLSFLFLIFLLWISDCVNIYIIKYFSITNWDKSYKTSHSFSSIISPLRNYVVLLQFFPCHWWKLGYLASPGDALGFLDICVLTSHKVDVSQLLVFIFSSEVIDWWLHFPSIELYLHILANITIYSNFHKRILWSFGIELHWKTWNEKKRLKQIFLLKFVYN